jgi:hypothetical protein
MRQESRVFPTPAPVDWERFAKGLLKAELALQGVTYKVLSQRLAALGVHANETAIANRISRGQFTFIFFLQCMSALGVTRVDLRGRSWDS